MSVLKWINPTILLWGWDWLGPSNLRKLGKGMDPQGDAKTSRSCWGIPSRELTYPTWRKGKSSSTCRLWGICSFPGGYIPMTSRWQNVPEVFLWSWKRYDFRVFPIPNLKRWFSDWMSGRVCWANMSLNISNTHTWDILGLYTTHWS